MVENSSGKEKKSKLTSLKIHCAKNFNPQIAVLSTPRQNFPTTSRMGRSHRLSINKKIQRNGAFSFLYNSQNKQGIPLREALLASKSTGRMPVKRIL
ncbi:hypothetical protein [Porphyromonas macacae]|uniref:hypothetical protein n=1 Tax=Porphyromonas macacae TaxID=28115 RepID=UPI0009DD8F1E|nr:hypothetical protein [Porphyromonas macacae]